MISWLPCQRYEQKCSMTHYYVLFPQNIHVDIALPRKSAQLKQQGTKNRQLYRLSKSLSVLKLLAKTYLLVPTSITAISGKLNARTKPQYVALERLKTAVNNGTWKQEAAKSKWDTSTEIWLWLALLEGKRTKKGAQSVWAGGKPDFCNAQVPQSNKGTGEFLSRATADRHLTYMPGRCNTMRFYFNKTPCCHQKLLMSLCFPDHEQRSNWEVTQRGAHVIDTLANFCKCNFTCEELGRRTNEQENQ